MKIYVMLRPQVAFGEDLIQKREYRSFDGIDEALLFYHFELPRYLAENYIVVFSNSFCFT